MKTGRQITVNTMQHGTYIIKTKTKKLYG